MWALNDLNLANNDFDQNYDLTFNGILTWLDNTNYEASKAHIHGKVSKKGTDSTSSLFTFTQNVPTTITQYMTCLVRLTLRIYIIESANTI